MAAKQRNDLLDRLVYLALRVVSMAVHSWGVGVAMELAKAVGTAMYVIDADGSNLRRLTTEQTLNPAWSR